jgi:hypothetical protein
VREIPALITADFNLYISQQLGQLENRDLSPRVEQPEVKRAEDDTIPTWIRKYKYANLSERSLIGLDEPLPDYPKQV